MKDVCLIPILPNEKCYRQYMRQALQNTRKRSTQNKKSPLYGYSDHPALYLTDEELATGAALDIAKDATFFEDILRTDKMLTDPVRQIFQRGLLGRKLQIERTLTLMGNKKDKKTAKPEKIKLTQRQIETARIAGGTESGEAFRDTIKIDWKKVKSSDRRKGTIDAWDSEHSYLGKFKSHDKALQAGAVFTKIGSIFFDFTTVFDVAAEAKSNDVVLDFVADLRYICKKHGVALSANAQLGISIYSNSVLKGAFTSADGDSILLADLSKILKG